MVPMENIDFIELLTSQQCSSRESILENPQEPLRILRESLTVTVLKVDAERRWQSIDCLGGK